MRRCGIFRCVFRFSRRPSLRFSFNNGHIESFLYHPRHYKITPHQHLRNAHHSSSFSRVTNLFHFHYHLCNMYVVMLYNVCMLTMFSIWFCCSCSSSLVLSSVNTVMSTAKRLVLSLRGRKESQTTAGTSSTRLVSANSLSPGHELDEIAVVSGSGDSCHALSYGSQPNGPSYTG